MGTAGWDRDRTGVRNGRVPTCGDEWDERECRMRVVYSSFSGRYSDSPRALHEALVATGRPIDHLWEADPEYRQGFPTGVDTVPAGGPEMVAALERADVVVSNTHLDLDWDKAPGTVYLQTWHGTPLKRIHFDVRWAPEGRLDRLTRDVRRWDALLSPNHASTPLLRGAFGFDGEVLESGYPRNDVLTGSRGAVVRRRLRRELEIADSTTVVLYAPTWRDDLVLTGGGEGFALQLDLDEIHRRLGDDVVVLLRVHYLVSRHLDVSGRPGVVDVSWHPDISELYLAADVMITDYSSTMFDFAVTGKPMIFFTYDLADYRDRLRGLYFDFPSIAPGPLLETSAEVVDALTDLPSLVDSHAEAYHRFRTRFCHLEDGHATDRVIERFLPGLRSSARDVVAGAPHLDEVAAPGLPHLLAGGPGRCG